jgi:hypothetical protein
VGGWRAAASGERERERDAPGASFMSMERATPRREIRISVRSILQKGNVTHMKGNDCMQLWASGFLLATFFLFVNGGTLAVPTPVGKR